MKVQHEHSENGTSVSDVSHGLVVISKLLTFHYTEIVFSLFGTNKLKTDSVCRSHMPT